MDVVDCAVLFNHRETASVFRLGLAYDAVARGAAPARFVMLSVGSLREQVVPRPFSLSDVYRDGEGRPVTEILYKPVGTVTNRLAGLQPGDSVSVGGVCGNGFPLPEPGRRPVLLAGGIGNAPFALQIRELAAGPFKDRPGDIAVLLAGRSGGDIFLQEAARRTGVAVIEATEDGSRGDKGRVTDVFLKRLPGWGPVEVFACGPGPMLEAVQDLALRHGFPCHLSVEERMACGYGVCNACAVEERREGIPRGEGDYLRACVDGPVFEAREICL